jgi:hypothetical protein
MEGLPHRWLQTVTAGDINYAAACGPLNAARRSLNPKDSSFGASHSLLLARDYSQ